MEILAVKLGDDIVEVLLRTKTIPFDHFHNRDNLPHYNWRWSLLRQTRCRVRGSRHVWDAIR